MTNQPDNDPSTAGTTLSDEQTAAIRSILDTKNDLQMLHDTPPSELRDATLLIDEFTGYEFSELNPDDVVYSYGLDDPDGAYEKTVKDVVHLLNILGSEPTENRLQGSRSRLDEYTAQYRTQGSVVDLMIEDHVARFRRARHQVVYRCPVCMGRLREVVSWTAEGGNVYPTRPTCIRRNCPGTLEPYAEVYIEKMPYPFHIDPEPERTRAQDIQSMVDPLTAHELSQPPITA